MIELEIPSHCSSLPSGVAATAIALGGYHTCVLLTEGGVKCWGDNEFGQMGISRWNPWIPVQLNYPVDIDLGSSECVRTRLCIRGDCVHGDFKMSAVSDADGGQTRISANRGDANHHARTRSHATCSRVFIVRSGDL